MTQMDLFGKSKSASYHLKNLMMYNFVALYQFVFNAMLHLTFDKNLNGSKRIYNYCLVFKIEPLIPLLLILYQQMYRHLCIDDI